MATRTAQPGCTYAPKCYNLHHSRNPPGVLSSQNKGAVYDGIENLTWTLPMGRFHSPDTPFLRIKVNYLALCAPGGNLGA